MKKRENIMNKTDKEDLVGGIGMSLLIIGYLIWAVLLYDWYDGIISLIMLMIFFFGGMYILLQSAID